MTLSIETSNKTFSDAMGNGLKYVVPKFQRDYAWTSEQWEDLWQDISDEGDGDEEHYMGYLVLQEGKDREEYIVIDGQQRIATISILILAVLKRLQRMIEENIEPDANRKRLDALKNTYIGFTDPVSLVTQPKLTLNRNNDTYFRNYLCGLEKKPPVRHIKASEKLLRNAYEFFIEKIDALEINDGAELAAFIKRVAGRLLFTQIKVGSDLNAYKVFETLNARGVKLSVPDLIKNFLFSIIDAKQTLHQEEIRQLEEIWEEITGQLGGNDFSRFIQAEWNSRNGLIAKHALFKKIKQGISSRESAFEYLRHLRESSEVYAALQNPDDDFWRREGYDGIQNSLRTFAMFNISQPHGLLIAAYLKFPPDKFLKIARYIEVISIRYNIIGRLQANRQEGIYNSISCAISNEEIKNLSGIREKLKDIYPDNKDFFNDFAHKHMKTAQSVKKVRFLLARIEEFVSGGINFSDAELTLEHILPTNPSEAWLEHFDHSEVDECADMIGNMTLVQSNLNRKLGNSSFTEKKAAFVSSPLTITKKCAEFPIWNREAIESRQKWLAEQAVACWRIEF